MFRTTVRSFWWGATNLNDDLEGSDFWDVVIDVLGEQ